MKMNFEPEDEPIRMIDYFNGDDVDDRAKTILNEYFIGWILIENDDPSINSLIRAKEYDYKRVGDGKTIIVKFDMEYTGDKGSPSLKHLKDVSVAKKENGWFDLMPTDKIYYLIALEEVPKDDEPPVPCERIRWYRKGKLHELKSFDDFIYNDI